MSEPSLSDHEAWCAHERRLRALVENASDMITVVASDLTIIFQAASGARLIGWRSDELEGKKFGDLVDPYGLDQLRVACSQAADGVAHRPVQLRLRHREGHWLDGETVVRYDGDERCLILTTRDVRERLRAERQLRRQAAQQTVIVQLGAQALAGAELPELMCRACTEVAATLDAEYAGVLEYVVEHDVFVPYANVGTQPYASPHAIAASRSTQPGVSVASSSPVIVRDWSAESDFDEASMFAQQGLASGISVAIPGANSPFGVISVQSTEANRFNYDDGVFLQAIANVVAAAIARADGEEKIRHQALHDAVTGLPNRCLFEDRLTLALAAASRHGRRLAVLFLDLDNFKRVNDSLGHAIGDVMLGAVAERLSGCLRAEDTIARFGGDEFAILLPEIDKDDEVTAIVDRITEALRVPLAAEDRQLITSASVGIAIGGAGRAGEDAQTLVRDADLAMYAAKQQGAGRSEFFADHMYDTAVRRLDLTADLYQAVKCEELEVHFQPIVTLDDEAIVGMEALIRWTHPRHGLLPPAAFLPLAEETGLIVPIGRFVLRTACEALREWQLGQERHRGLHMSVNVGAQEINAPDLVDYVASVLADTGLSPSSLIIEITEDVLLATNNSVLTQLQGLKELGLRLAVDDFGTGYSALSHLQRFPMDIIKIDKTFVDGIGENSEQDRLVRGIIDLAHGLHLETVAEGIERPEQAAVLRTMHSELGQGFHFAKPLSRRDMELILAPVPTAAAADTRPVLS